MTYDIFLAYIKENIPLYIVFGFLIVEHPIELHDFISLLSKEKDNSLPFQGKDIYHQFGIALGLTAIQIQRVLNQDTRQESSDSSSISSAIFARWRNKKPDASIMNLLDGVECIAPSTVSESLKTQVISMLIGTACNR